MSRKKSGFSSRVKPPQAQKLTAKRKMILTTCASCAAPLAHNAPRCVRCQTRYCNKTCHRCERYEEAKPFLRARIPEAASELGTEHATVLTLRCNYASALFTEGRSRDNLVEAVALLEELSSTARRVFGTAHPITMTISGNLGRARLRLASFAAAP